MKKFISMVSGGIDSPVATYLIMKKGYECIAVHFNNEPFSDKLPLEKTEKLLKMLSKTKPFRCTYLWHDTRARGTMVTASLGKSNSKRSASSADAETSLANGVCKYMQTEICTSLRQKRRRLKVTQKPVKRKITLYIVPHGPNQAEFVRKCERKYTCLFCRRMQYRIAEKIAEKEEAELIVTGEALGQKASQTIDNLLVTDKTIKTPVIRPLIGMDKEDIIDISRKIGIFEESSISAPCCTIVPDQPSTKAMIEKIEEEEEKLDIEKLIENSLKKTKIISISP